MLRPLSSYITSPHHRPKLSSCPLCLMLALLLVGCGIERPGDDAMVVNSLPPIYPDYIDVTIPAEIAPMCFDVDSADYVYVKITGADGSQIEADGSWTDIDIDTWHSLTAASRGGSLRFDVSARDHKGQWTTYQPFYMHVSEYPLSDYGVTYRKIAPGFETFSKIGIYQRDLSTYEESPILEETAVHGQCLNCHYANRANPEHFSLHVRGANGGTIVSKGDKLQYLNTKTDVTNASCTYGYWHPEGRYCAYSLNRIYQNFYVGERQYVEPWDQVSDIAVLDTETQELILTPLLLTDDCETTPAFSPDGTMIYYCYAPKVNMPGEYDKLKYSICTIGFDAATGRFAQKIDTLISSSALDKSLSLPRPSYDGRYLMYCVTDYGTTPVDHPDADLWLMDLSTGESRPLTEANSQEADAYHNWSSDSRWYLFGSRRGDGLYANLYFASIGDDGRSTKPFLMPQRDPRKFYRQSLYSYNAPDFTTVKVDLDARAVRKMAMEGQTQQISAKRQ